jgi:hypothetical protein
LYAELHFVKVDAGFRMEDYKYDENIKEELGITVLAY